jgi:maleate isomerase
MNPGLYDGLRGALRVPVTTALTACSAALRAFDASRVLLMTPFTERMNARIRDYLANRGIESSTFGEFDRVTEASILGPEQVRQRARAALETAGRVDAIYFQGAVLDPLKVIETLEQETELPVVASNPAMLWFILSQLGRRYSIEGYGNLVRRWPAVPA